MDGFPYVNSPRALLSFLTRRSALAFLFALCTAAALVIWFGVDIEKGRADAVKFAVEQRAISGAVASSGESDSERGDTKATTVR